MPAISTVKENVAYVRNKVPKEVVIVAAAKKQSIRKILEAADAGIRIIGENYVQEAEHVHDHIKDMPGVELHCIGPLQSNKVRKAVKIFDMIQTVDSLKLAKEIDKRAAGLNKPGAEGMPAAEKKPEGTGGPSLGSPGSRYPILLQVNIGKEESKSGVMPEDCAELARDISSLGNLRIMGLMAIPPYFAQPEYGRGYFREMKQLFDTLAMTEIPGVEMRWLSMGMSPDYEIAVQEGANMVRIGTAFFGERV
ncbi:YggS family pyridoxal phosphate-dependent enzyme [Candidatus Woesearchaeota archaeon]|nr:YggS family pyridoxal phosphate-dependent enzyme [Candidatus Woesearchaeota archaeon]